MTVYELIQELSQYKADTEVRFHVKAEFDTDVEAEFDRNDENDEQEVTVTAEFDDDVACSEILNYENYRYTRNNSPYIQLNFEY